MCIRDRGQAKRGENERGGGKRDEGPQNGGKEGGKGGGREGGERGQGVLAAPPLIPLACEEETREWVSATYGSLTHHCTQRRGTTEVRVHAFGAR
eukprot:3574172-Rhodomonas_salina.1